VAVSGRFPHSIQGLRPNGCEFLLVFGEGDFSEDGTFLLSQTVAHTPRNILAKNFRLDKEVIAKLVRKEELYIFPADLPLSVAQDRASTGGQRVESPINYTFKMAAMNPHGKHREAKFVLWTQVISPFPRMSLQR
jgi:oxalate decarboxylase